MADDYDHGVGISLRELVLEIRADVKDLNTKVEHIDREGSIGTKLEMEDHEKRLRMLERYRYALPASIIIAIGGGVAIILRAFGT